MSMVVCTYVSMNMHAFLVCQFNAQNGRGRGGWKRNLLLSTMAVLSLSLITMAGTFTLANDTGESSMQPVAALLRKVMIIIVISLPPSLSLSLWTG